MLLRPLTRLLFPRCTVCLSLPRSYSGSPGYMEGKQQISKRKPGTLIFFPQDIHKTRDKRSSFPQDHPADHPKIVVRKMEVEFIDGLLKMFEESEQVTVDQLCLLYQDLLNKYESEELPCQLIVDMLTQFLATYDMQWIKSQVMPQILQVTEHLGKCSANVCYSCILAYSPLTSLTSDLDEFVSTAYQRLVDISSQKDNFFMVPGLRLAVTRVVSMSSSWQKLTANALQQNGRHFAATNQLINKAAVEGDFQTAFKLLPNEDLGERRRHHINRYRAFDSSLTTLLSQLPAHTLPQLFAILANMHIEISERHSSLIMDKWDEWALGSGVKTRATLTTLNDKGECQSCKTKLDDSVLTTEEIGVLKSAFYEKYIIEGGIYKVSAPQIFKKFERRLRQEKPYDLVIDGMNAFHWHTKATPQTTHNIRQHMVKQVEDVAAGGKKRILVTIRKHAVSWIPQEISHLMDTYVIDNTFEDDVFTLYATLCSGPNCHIMSSDDFSDHFHALTEIEDYKAFSALQRWLRTRRVMRAPDFLILRGIDVFTNVDRKGRSLGRYTTPLETAIKPQTHAGCWHLPIYNNLLAVNKPRWSDMQQWLCLPALTPSCLDR